MIKGIRLTNFRKHRDLKLDFEQGLVVIRALNEGGKSTVLEAMMYALYGSRVLRNSLADTVTYGMKDSALRVEADFDFGGDLYTFTRHKGGAEVYVNGSEAPYVTGQTEVTAFAAKLVGADAVTANKLMMASQGNLRGSLEQGPKATSEMIEGLADFDLFDFLLDKMSTELALGSSAHLERSMDELQETLDGLGQVDYEGAVRDKLQEKVVWEEKLDACSLEHEVISDRRKGVVDKLEAAQTENKQRQKLMDTFKTLSEDIQRREKVMQGLIAVATQPVPLGEIAEVESTLRGATELSRKHRVYMEFLNLPKLDAEWEGDYDYLSRYIEEKKEEQGKLTNQLLTLDVQDRNLDAQFIHERDCPTCGQNLPDLDKIHETNAELAKQQVAIQNQKEELEGQLSNVKEELHGLAAFTKSIQPALAFTRTYSEYLNLDTNFVPPRMSWAGDIPGEAPNVSELETKLQTLRAEETRIKEAQRDQVHASEMLENLRGQLDETSRWLDVTTETPVDELEKELEHLEEEDEALWGKVQEMRQTVSHISTEIQTLKIRQEHELTSRNDLTTRLERLKEDIENLEFNNNLLKKVRLARPLVSDQLWNMVLAAVSTMFTKKRGVQSHVTKDKDGFKVNGEAVTGLSGSTLDLLGASIRVALIRTFIPNCPFVVYDEPFAAMDDQRTASMLAFIQSAGFRQTLVVTHEDVSEQVADQLITL